MHSCAQITKSRYRSQVPGRARGVVGCHPYSGLLCSPAAGLSNRMFKFARGCCAAYGIAPAGESLLRARLCRSSDVHVLIVGLCKVVTSLHRRNPPAMGAGGGVLPLSLLRSCSLSFFFVLTLLSSTLGRLCVTLFGSFTGVPPNRGCITAISLSSGKLSSTKLKK